MSLLELAKALRPIIEQAAQSLQDTTALQAVTLYPRWQAGQSYTAWQRVQYGGVLYRVLADHVSQEDWTPEQSPSLFARVLIPSETEIPEWEQPESTNAYCVGDRVRFAGAVYESRIDNNIWSPMDYPAGWKLVEEGG